MADRVEQLPSGLDTPLAGEGRGHGIVVSTEQRQLLALARRLYRADRRMTTLCRMVAFYVRREPRRRETAQQAPNRKSQLMLLL